MAREADASYEGQGQRQSTDIPRTKVRLDGSYERINIAGGLNSKIVFSDTSQAGLQSRGPNSGNMYRPQLQVNGTITVYSSTDGGTTFSLQIAILNNRLRLSQTPEAYDGKNNRPVPGVYDDGDGYNYGSEVILEGGDDIYVSSGESATDLYNAQGISAGETMYPTSDNGIALVISCDMISNCKTAYLFVSALYLVTNRALTLGTLSLRWGQIHPTAASISTSDRD